MYIQRHIEEVFKENFTSSKAVAVIGARQVGKTTMTKQLYPDFMRLNMKDRRLLNAAADDPHLFLDSFKRPVFIDEVQNAPFLLDEVKVVLDEVREKGNYIFSGSQKWELMKGLSESLAGMVSILEMTTLSMREIMGIDCRQPFSLSDAYLVQKGSYCQKIR